MLFQFDPFRNLDRLTEQMLSDWRAARPVPMDVYRSGDHYVLHFDLPGIDPSSVDVSVQENSLTVRAVRPQRTTEGVEYVVAERPTGEFTRQLVLGSGLDVGKISATYDAGVLTITVPVAETAKPRRIQVGVGDSGPKVIEGRHGEQTEVGGGS
jgi:HSP20 family protein